MQVPAGFTPALLLCDHLCHLPAKQRYVRIMPILLIHKQAVLCKLCILDLYLRLNCCSWNVTILLTIILSETCNRGLHQVTNIFNIKTWAVAWIFSQKPMLQKVLNESHQLKYLRLVTNIEISNQLEWTGLKIKDWAAPVKAALPQDRFDWTTHSRSYMRSPCKPNGYEDSPKLFKIEAESVRPGFCRTLPVSSPNVPAFWTSAHRADVWRGETGRQCRRTRPYLCPCPFRQAWRATRVSFCFRAVRKGRPRKGAACSPVCRTTPAPRPRWWSGTLDRRLRCCWRSCTKRVCGWNMKSGQWLTCKNKWFLAHGENDKNTTSRNRKNKAIFLDSLRLSQHGKETPSDVNPKHALSQNHFRCWII